MYDLPNINILSTSDDFNSDDYMEIAAREADAISEKLGEMGARCNCEKIDIGPQVIRFSLVAAEGVKVRDIPKLAPELQYDLGTESITIQAPQPGEKFIVVEIANPNRRLITTGDVIHAAKSPLTIPLGINPSNEIITADIRSMPHCLIAGTTGSGKSVALHNMISSLLMTTTPDELGFMLVDTKMVELTAYDGIPNLICPVITDAWEAIKHFKALVMMMERRYELAREHGAKTLEELNQCLSKPLTYTLVVVDEVADLMYISRKEIEESIVRIAQKARAVGIHMILSTQSPRRDIITGLLKANLPSRIGFATTSGLDSRIVMDKMGCESLLKNGDMLYSDQGKPPIRIQSPFISTEEIESIVSQLSHQTERIAA